MCTYFHDGKGCPKCPLNCPREAHVRAIKIPKHVTETIEVSGLQKVSFGRSQECRTAAQVKMDEKRTEMEDLTRAMLADMQSLKDSKTKLDEIALRPTRAASSAKLFAQMIAEEKSSKSPGWRARVAGLELAKGRAETIEMMSSAKEPRDLYPKYQETIQALIEQGESCPSAPKRENCCVM